MKSRSGGASGRGLRSALLLACAFLLIASPVRAQKSEDCLACHSDSTLTMEKRGATVSIHVNSALLGKSAHKDLACVDCHAGFSPEEIPHKARIGPINCMSCHSGAPEQHPFHTMMAEATGTDGKPGTSCKGCHGTHGVVPVAAPESPFHSSHLVASCGKCHETIAQHFAQSAHGTTLAAGQAGAPDCLKCHQNPITSQRAGGPSADLKITQEKICLSCHLDNPEVKARMAPDAGFIAAYEKSVHGAALMRGVGEAATCIDCHGSHEMEKGTDPRGRVNKAHIPETCAACHSKIAAQYLESTHAAAFRRGNTEAPVCTNCHGEHNILLHTDPNSPVAAGNVSAQVCSPCHSSVKMSQKYGIASDRFKTFSDTYHGLALSGGSLQAANCASCHGAHGILPSSNPASSISKTNIAATCGRCHPGANERFARGAVHVTITQKEEPILYWIATTYLMLIIATVGGMFAHNMADFIRKSIRRFRIRSGDLVEEHAGRALYPRMTLNERFQHGSLMLSFMTLAVTGFMLSYPDAWWVVSIRRLNGHIFELRSLLHRIAAVVMVAASLYHVGYLGFAARGRSLLRDMLPRPADVREAIAAVGYNLGLNRHRPLFGRFSYIEKVEYWALIWGTIVMAVTGVFMWFENTFISITTKLGYDIARTIHFYEAVLATLAILIWHIYYVIFNPEAYPMNTAWLTGTLTEAEMAEEHPLELEAIKRREAEVEQAG